jgi:hypothetical protein
MLLESLGYKQLLLWHGRGHRFDRDQVAGAITIPGVGIESNFEMHFRDVALPRNQLGGNNPT